MTDMTARRPYMLRAVYEWLVDNQLTPHLVVDAETPGCQVPREFVNEGQIVLNIAPSAVGNLQLLNDRVEFNARFGGKPQQVWVPMLAVTALYARENGAGTIFEEEPQLAASEASEQPPEPPTKKRPNLKVIK
ncbi:ClpXP protease specificity-enhancing factor [Pseudidiomarina piscicola]|uniref:ClpXP protease specificity-enhancing factor n=1 Tax=Pseudidiomarina piscicola TaxID=2614830 RepID=UPI001C2DC6AC|nr:ClpXP protease specificity-enhancing factor [Pseudidiomarina piscicola]